VVSTVQVFLVQPVDNCTSSNTEHPFAYWKEVSVSSSIPSDSLKKTLLTVSNVFQQDHDMEYFLLVPFYGLSLRSSVLNSCILLTCVFTWNQGLIQAFLKWVFITAVQLYMYCFSLLT